MCTVTFIPLGNNDFILTSNRDEDPSRKTIPPKKYIEEDVSLIYPKDELAGGTWIGLSENKRLICLLNGGFVKHQRAKTYEKSRGVIVKELLISTDAVAVIENYDFKNIEPFTIVLVDWKDGLKAYELVWTGEHKRFNLLEDEPKIWSSATLYDAEMTKKRKVWFANWLETIDEFSQQQIIDFHKDDTKGSPEVTFKMKRETVETVSVTSIKKETEKVAIKYIDVLTDTVYNKAI